MKEVATPLAQVRQQGEQRGGLQQAQAIQVRHHRHQVAARQAVLLRHSRLQAPRQGLQEVCAHLASMRGPSEMPGTHPDAW